MATATPTSPAADPEVHRRAYQAVAAHWRQPIGPDDHCHECRHGTAADAAAAALPDVHAQLDHGDWLFVVNEAERQFLADW